MRAPRLAGLASLLLAAVPLSAANQVIYDNALQNGWQDWSWAAHNLAQSTIYQSAPAAISWEPDAVNGDWQGIYFHSNPGAADPAVADFTAVASGLTAPGATRPCGSRSTRTTSRSGART